MINISPAEIYLANLSVNSRPTMRYSLIIIANILEYEHYDEINWSEIQYKHTAYVRLKLIEKEYAAATINRKLACLRGVLKEAWRLDIISAERYHRAADLEKVRGNSPRLGRVITIEEQRRLARVCLNNPKIIGQRDYAIISVARLGLRSIEISRLRLSDLKEERLEIYGKGNKHRSIPLPAWAKEAIDRWLAVRGSKAGPLFTKVLQGTFLTEDGIGRRGVSSRIKRIAKMAGVDISSHCFRFTFVSESLRRGLDLVSVQKAVGHSSPTVTAKYDLRDQSALRAVMDMFEDVSCDV